MREYIFYRVVCEVDWGCGWGDRGEERRAVKVLFKEGFVDGYGDDG